MEHPLTIIPNSQIIDQAQDLAGRVQKIKDFLNATHSKADNTIRAYCSAWRDFQTWCLSFPKPIESLPVTPQDLAAYLVEMANGERGKQIIRECQARGQKITRQHRQAAENGHKVSVIHLRLSAINRAHFMAGLPMPSKNIIISETMDKISRAKGVRQEGKAAILVDDIKKILALFPAGTRKTARDRALILVGFAGAFRRSELVALNVADVEPAPKGLIIRIRKSKTDQVGEGQNIPIFFGENKETCPVSALQDWLKNIESGPIFRPIDRHDNIRPERLTDHSVAFIIKTAVEKAGYNKDRFAGHSLRAGFVTQADINGASYREIMKTTRHKDTKMIDRYTRDTDVFRNNAGEKIGL